MSVRVCIHIYSYTTLYTGLKQGVLFLPYTPVDSETLAYAVSQSQCLPQPFICIKLN